MNDVFRPDGLYDSQHRHDMYRWHVMDPVRFERDIAVNHPDIGLAFGRAVSIRACTTYVPSRTGIRTPRNRRNGPSARATNWKWCDRHGAARTERSHFSAQRGGILAGQADPDGINAAFREHARVEIAAVGALFAAVIQQRTTRPTG